MSKVELYVVSALQAPVGGERKGTEYRFAVAAESAEEAIAKARYEADWKCNGAAMSAVTAESYGGVVSLGIRRV